MADALTRVQRLEATRDQLSAALVAAEPAQVAALSREYRAVLAELAELQPEAPSAKPAKGSVDEIAARRAGRKSDPAGSGSAAVQ